MSQVLGLRPFLPAQDFAVSKRFYLALGFAVTLEDDSVAILTLGDFSFLLTKFYDQAFAENCMVQLLVRDADAWWAQAAPESLAAEFGLRLVRPPSMQPWGLKVGFLSDPCGVLWHIAEARS